MLGFFALVVIPCQYCWYLVDSYVFVNVNSSNNYFVDVGICFLFRRIQHLRIECIIKRIVDLGNVKEAEELYRWLDIRWHDAVSS